MDHEAAAAPERGTERVSVVLATFNGEKFLDEQLQTVAGQTRLPDELVAFDDGSNDRTVEILHSFARVAPFPVEVIAPGDHVGTCEAFGETMRRATGTILAICDQDDIWEPEKLAVMEQRMVGRPDALLAFSDATLIKIDGTPLSRSRWRLAGFGPSQWASMERDVFGEMLKRQIVSGCTAAIRSEILPALLPFPSGLHPALPTMMYDRWISLMAAAAAPVQTIPERLVQYRIHPAQQIGIPALELRRLLPQAALRVGQFVAPRVEKSGRFAYHRVHLREIHKRLAAAGLDSGESDLRLRLASQHLEVRETLDDSSWRQRVQPVLRQYVEADGYRRFSMGLSAALSDVAR